MPIWSVITTLKILSSGIFNSSIVETCFTRINNIYNNSKAYLSHKDNTLLHDVVEAFFQAFCLKFADIIF